MCVSCIKGNNVSLILILVLQAQPLKPRRDRPEKALEESQHKTAKLRELEEELLGGGQREPEEEEKEQIDREKTETGDEEYGTCLVRCIPHGKKYGMSCKVYITG